MNSVSALSASIRSHRGGTDVAQWIGENRRVENAAIDGEIACVDDLGRSVFNDLLFRKRETCVLRVRPAVNGGDREDCRKSNGKCGSRSCCAGNAHECSTVITSRRVATDGCREAIAKMVGRTAISREACATGEVRPSGDCARLERPQLTRSPDRRAPRATAGSSGRGLWRS